MDRPNLENTDRELRAVEERLRRMDGVGDALKEVSASFTTPDGLVTLELGIDGAPRQLHLDPRAMRLPSAALAELILTAFAGARAEMESSVGAVLSQILGEDVTPSSMLTNADDFQEKMSGMLSEVTRQMNDAIVEVERLGRRRGR